MVACALDVGGDHSVAVQEDGSLGFAKRATAPNLRTGHGELSFRVWAHSPSYLEEPLPWRCVAAFCYLTECLDAIAGYQDAGVDVVFQSQADVRLIRASDRRVVYKGE